MDCQSAHPNAVDFRFWIAYTDNSHISLTKQELYRVGLQIRAPFYYYQLLCQLFSWFYQKIAESTHHKILESSNFLRSLKLSMWNPNTLNLQKSKTKKSNKSSRSKMHIETLQIFSWQLQMSCFVRRIYWPAVLNYKYSVYYHAWQRTASNHHIWETRKANIGLFLTKWLKLLLNHQNSCQIISCGLTNQWINLSLKL